MRLQMIRYLVLALFLAISATALVGSGKAQKTASISSLDAASGKPNVWPKVWPRVWGDEEMADVELPLANAANSPKHISADYYYRIPVRPIYKSYPAYAPGKEPQGYQNWLKQQEPEVITFDASKLKTQADWIKAGEMIFDSPIFYNAVVKAEHITDPAWYEKTGTLAAKDGTLPYFNYVVREKGKVELGTISCAMCHTRVLPTGQSLKARRGICLLSVLLFIRLKIFP